MVDFATLKERTTNYALVTRCPVCGWFIRFSGEHVFNNKPQCWSRQPEYTGKA